MFIRVLSHLQNSPHYYPQLQSQSHQRIHRLLRDVKPERVGKLSIVRSKHLLEALFDTKLFHLDKDARRELGENGRLYAEQHFSLDRLALELIRRLESVQADCRRNSR